MLNLLQLLSAELFQLELKKGGRYFGGLFVYWLMLIVFGAIVLYSKIRRATGEVSAVCLLSCCIYRCLSVRLCCLVLQNGIECMFRFTTFIIHYTLVWLQMILSLIPHPGFASSQVCYVCSIITTYIKRVCDLATCRKVANSLIV